MHITFSLGSARGGGGGGSTPKPPRSAPATSLVIFFSILIYWSSYIICWSFRITRFQRIPFFHNEKLLHVSNLPRSSPAPADIGHRRAHQYYRRSIATADGRISCTASFRCLYRQYLIEMGGKAPSQFHFIGFKFDTQYCVKVISEKIIFIL